MKRIFKAGLAASFALVPLAAGAITLLPPCTATGNCGISDILGVFINLAEFLLGIVGAVALGYFVYGGFVFILSRGNKGEVDRAFGILRSAAIGIFIIFLSGVFVRFTTQALTGGVSKIPTVGETCNSAKSVSVPKNCEKDSDCGGLGSCKSDGTCSAADGLWVMIPSGSKDGKVIPEGLECVKKGTGMKVNDKCIDLNSKLESHGRTEEFTCINVSGARTCVRGLCSGSGLGGDFACCLK